MAVQWPFRVVATMIYDHEWRGAEVRRNFGVLTLSFQMARRTDVNRCLSRRCDSFESKMNCQTLVQIEPSGAELLAAHIKFSGSLTFALSRTATSP